MIGLLMIDSVCARRCLDLFQRLWNESPRDHKPHECPSFFSIFPFFPFFHFFHFSHVFHLSVERTSVVVTF